MSGTVSAEIMQEPDNQPKKRISLELKGDDVIKADILETSLQLNRLSRSKSERDAELVSLGLSALEFVMMQVSKESGKKYPSAQDVRSFLNLGFIEV
jgi:hypothetical protein